MSAERTLIIRIIMRLTGRAVDEAGKKMGPKLP